MPERTQAGQPHSLAIDRRRRVGWVAIVCLVAAAGGFAVEGFESAWAAAASRVGIVLGALWLCLPTKTRPAAWASLSPGKVAAVSIAALFMNRIRIFLPFLAVAGFIVWALRPRNKRS
jgi:hypothetical protein